MSGFTFSLFFISGLSQNKQRSRDEDNISFTYFMCIFRVIKTINTLIPKYDQKNLQLRLPIIIYMTLFTCRANLDTQTWSFHIASNISRVPIF